MTFVPETDMQRYGRLHGMSGALLELEYMNKWASIGGSIGRDLDLKPGDAIEWNVCDGLTAIRRGKYASCVKHND